MASVFLYHVVGDLTVGKPELVEFHETETVDSAIRAIGESTECGIPVWKRSQVGAVENADSRQQRFVGILNSLDIVDFLARNECVVDREKALKTPVSQVVFPNSSLLWEADPGTRLIDALEMMKHGVRRLLVPKSRGWKGMSKRFSVLYNGRWLKNINSSGSISTNIAVSNRGSSSSATSMGHNKFCCLTREDVIRFLIGCLGALAPLPLSSIASLGAVNSNFCFIEATLPAVEATSKHPEEPCAVAVVDTLLDGRYKIMGEISSSRLWKCDYLAAAWALANLTAGQFVMGVEDNVHSRAPPDLPVSSSAGGGNATSGSPSMQPKRFSSRSIGFSSNLGNASFGGGRSIYRGRSAPLMCTLNSSLAAVMAQMLSHRSTHVWVTEAESEDVLVGVVGYADILAAVTKPLPTAAAPVTNPPAVLVTMPESTE